MSHLTRAVLAFGLVAFVAACAPKVEEPAYVDTPVAAEPTFSGKYN